MSGQTIQMFKGRNFSRFLAVSLSAALLATTALPVSSASAHDRRGYHKHHNKHHVRKRHKHRNNSGDVLAAGVIGLAVGAIIAGSHNNHRHRPHRSRRHGTIVYEERISPPTPVYEERIYDEPYYDRNRIDGPYRRGSVERQSLDDVDNGPKVITYEDTASVSLEPWSPGWVSYCKRKYRSFNARTGTFLGYDGKRKFCVIR